MCIWWWWWWWSQLNERLNPMHVVGDSSVKTVLAVASASLAPTDQSYQCPSMVKTSHHGSTRVAFTCIGHTFQSISGTEHIASYLERSGAHALTLVHKRKSQMLQIPRMYSVLSHLTPTGHVTCQGKQRHYRAEQRREAHCWARFEIYRILLMIQGWMMKRKRKKKLVEKRRWCQRTLVATCPTRRHRSAARSR